MFILSLGANKPFQILAQLLILSDLFQIALAVARRARAALFNELISISDPKVGGKEKINTVFVSVSFLSSPRVSRPRPSHAPSTCKSKIMQLI